MKKVCFPFAFIFCIMSSIIFVSCGNDNDDDVTEEEIDVCDYMEDWLLISWCRNNYDVNHDGKVSKSEAEAVKEFAPMANGVHYVFSSMKGLEYFTGLERLILRGSFRNIDLTKMEKLKHLDILSRTQYFNLSNNKALTYISLDNDETQGSKDQPAIVIKGFENLHYSYACLPDYTMLDELDFTIGVVEAQDLIIKRIVVNQNQYDQLIGTSRRYEDYSIMGELYHHNTSDQLNLYWQEYFIKN